MDDKGYTLYICEYDKNQAIAVVNYPDEYNSTIMDCERHLIKDGWIIIKLDQGMYIHCYRDLGKE